MSKRRPETEKRPRSYWPTPEKAIAPLLPYLLPQTRFIEPCAGDGSLIRGLEKHGHICEAAFDIEPMFPGAVQLDALTMQWPEEPLYITNPPWERHVLHPMLGLWAKCWLLFDSNWIWTKRARPYAQRCKLIVPVGRVKWIPDSKHSSMDDCAWFYFEKGHASGPRISLSE